MGSPRQPKIARRLLSLAGGAFGTILVVLFFLANLIVGAILHLNLPVSRRAAAQILISVVSDSLRGTIRVSSFARFSQRGISAEEIEVLDPEGRLVLQIKNLSADVDVLTILDRVFSRNEKLSIEIERVQAEDCEVFVLPTTSRGEDGSLLNYPSIADAFEPVKDTDRPSSSASRPVRVWFPHVTLKNVYARGSLAGSPTLEVRVAGARAQVLATDKGASIDIQRFNMRASGLAGVDATAQGEVHIRAPGPVWGDVSGTLGEVPVIQKFRFDDGSLTVEGQFPSLEPQAVRPLLSDWPLDRPIAVRNRIDGTLDVLSVVAEIYTESSQEGRPPGSIVGTVRLTPQFGADLRLVTDDLDLNHFLEDLPETRLDSDSHIEIQTADDELQIEFETRVEEGLIEGETTPIVLATGKFSGNTLTVEGTLEERGLSARVHLEHSTDAGSQLRVDLSNLSLHENKRTAILAQGARGFVSGNARATLKENAFEIQTDLNVAGFQYDDLSFEGGKLSASASGDTESWEESTGTVELNLKAPRFGAFKLNQGTLSMEGALLKPALRVTALTEAGLTLEAEARSSLLEREFTGVSATLSGRDRPILASADRVSLAGSRVKVQKLAVTSVGEIRGDVDMGADGGRIDLEAEGLSVSRIAESLNLPQNELGGTLNANIHLTVGAHSEGTFDVNVKDGAFQGIDKIELDAHATVDGNATRGNLNGSIANLGEIESSWQMTLAGSLLRGESYRRATGTLSANLKRLDLSGISLLAGKSWGLPDVSGSLSASANLKRSSPYSFPEGEISFSTSNLAGVIPTENEKLRISGIEIDGAMSLRPDAEQVEAVIRFDDSVGTLASISGTLDLPLAAWDKHLPGSASELKRTIMTSALNAVLVVPRRNVRRWPEFIPHPLDSGSLGLRASATGTLESPEVSFVLDARNLDGAASPFSRPVDISVNARYVASSDTLRGSANLISEGSRTSALQFDLIVPFSHLASPPPKNVAFWTGTGQLQLDNTPLDLFKELAERKMQGRAQGVISLSRPSWSTDVGAEVRLRGLEFGGHRLGDAILEAHTYDSDFVARAQFTDEYGSLQTTFEAGIITTSEFLQLAQDRPMLATLQAERYDAAVALPFVANLLDELSGSLTGKLRAEWTPPQKASGPWATSLTGTMKMTDGIVAPAALGLRLEDTRLQAVASVEGKLNVVRIYNVAARAESKSHNLTGDAILYFENLDLQGGTFHFSPEDMPLKSDDSELARLTGTAQGRFDMTGKETRVELTINNMVATLPSRSDSNLFNLAENPSIEILQHAASDLPKEEPAKPSTVTLLRFQLGNNVRLKSEMIDIKMRGAPEMRIAEELQMSGAIELIPGGRIDVLGRGFNVEAGAVLFDTGDASDPHLNASAAWRAPNGVLVRATVTGTAKAPKIDWSSEPALPGGEAEVIALVLGGGGGSSDQSRAGISSALALGASEALGQTGVVSGVEFYTTQEAGSGEGRVASLNDSSWDSYTAAFRIREDLWFEGSYQQGSSTALAAEARSGVSGTLDWRFHPNWSARTEIGMLGAGLDLVWRYRY